MIREDYIMRLVERFTKSMKRILGLKEQDKVEDTINAIGETYRNLLDSSIVHSLSTEDILYLMDYEGRLNSYKCQILANLLREEGDIYLAAGNTEITQKRYQKAMEFLSRIFLEQKEDNQDIENLKVEIEKKIKDIEGVSTID